MCGGGLAQWGPMRRKVRPPGRSNPDSGSRLSTVRGSNPLAEGLGPALTFFCFRGAAWLAERLPYAASNRIASVAAVSTYRLARNKRAIVRKNLARVVGTGPHLENLVRRAFLSYAEYWLETFRLGKYTAEDLRMMVVADDKATRGIQEALSRGTGVLIVTPHFGLYDLGSAWMGAQGWPVTTVAEVLKPRALYEWFTKLRSRWGVRIVPAERGRLTRVIGQILGNGEILALVADRDLGRRGVWTEFFGEFTTLPATPPKLMAKTQIPLFAGIMYRDAGRLRVHLERVPYEISGEEEQDVRRCARVVALAFERLISQAPEHWHLFRPNWPSDEPDLPPRGSKRDLPPYSSLPPPIGGQ